MDKAGPLSTGSHFPIEFIPVPSSYRIVLIFSFLRFFFLLDQGFISSERLFSFSVYVFVEHVCLLSVFPFLP